MSKDVETINESQNLFDVSRLFRTLDVKWLPVVNTDNRFVGVVSVDYVMAILAWEMFDTFSSLEPKFSHMV